MLYTVVKEKQRTERAAVAGGSQDLSRRCRNRHPAYSRVRKRDYSDVAPLLLLHDVSTRTICRRAGGVCGIEEVADIFTKSRHKGGAPDMDLKKPKNITELIKAQRVLLRKYARHMRYLVNEKYKNAALLTYWLFDYLRYLQMEDTFNPRFNIKYQRGQIVYVNFGYRIGSELGGCHYAIVLDVKNSKTNSQVTVIPLKSKREKETPYSAVYHVDIQSEIFRLLLSKAKEIGRVEREKLQQSTTPDDIKRVKKQLDIADSVIDFAEEKMNKSSVADLGQISTISKIRIVHPTKTRDPLSGICLSDESMRRIEDKLHFLFFSNRI